MNHSFLKNQETDLETVTIETPRCTIEPFRMEWIGFQTLQQAFPGVDRDFYIGAIKNRKNQKALECFIFEKWSRNIIGSIGMDSLDASEPNIGLWIREEYQREWYGTEVYSTMIEWVKTNTYIVFLKHTTSQENIASIKLAEHFNGILQKVLTERGHLKYYIYLN